MPVKEGKRIAKLAVGVGVSCHIMFDTRQPSTTCQVKTAFLGQIMCKILPKWEKLIHAFIFCCNSWNISWKRKILSLKWKEIKKRNLNGILDIWMWFEIYNKAVLHLTRRKIHLSIKKKTVFLFLTRTHALNS